ncbi:heterokaryon incompatibility protein-domain-containing protein [Lasiosphaeria miniovina]|uniref:Heterokaryon incompatibility protein-domain-containing protein n=1 Tax=Lasiosphaeria miniovina TaxID=1954250 RepID=A0AA39ZQ82_9PEZI|nr:heterokaryon incompatibility protein-domain-containing protein [Lasiosphaeria miniovina]KAK0701573.1 heterokaryon incompatibility protein-domain-containing protein [Lasiosphaeria miniovina]
MDASRYRYQVLSLPAETRILTIAPGKFNDALVCSLTHIHIASPGEPYDALSYCWSGSVVVDKQPDPEQVLLCAVYGRDEDGNLVNESYELACKDMLDHRHYASSYIRLGFKLPDGPIFIDGVEVVISGELRRALQRLRSEEEPLRLWVDALCINQGDIAERNQHVRMMGQIYANATRVRIWLGEEIGIEMEMMNTINAVYEIMTDLLVTQGMLEQDASLGQIQWSFMNDERTANLEWEKLAELFHRTWVIQEIAKAKEALLHIGSLELNWSYLAGCFMALKRYRLDAPIADYKGIKAICMMESLRQEIATKDQGCSETPLLTLLEELRDFKSTMASDKLYGIIGLTSDPIAQRLSVNYTKTPEQIFTDLATDYYNSNSLKILSHCVSAPTKQSTLTLPSWVPDWSISGYVEPHYIRGLNANACGALSNPSLRISFPALYIKGRLLDSLAAVETKKWIPPPRVDYHIRTTTEDDNFGSDKDNEQGTQADPAMKNIDPAYRSRKHTQRFLANLRDQQKEIVGIAFPDKVYTAETYEALWRTFMCNRTREGEVPEAGAGAMGFEIHMDVVLGKGGPRAVLAEKKACMLRHGHLVNEEAEAWLRGATEAYEMVSGATSKWCHNRRFFRSNAGRYGWAVDGVRAGDVVAVFYGAQFPFVLREVDGTEGEGKRYRILGDCFVQGLMEGEGMNETDVDKETEFCIV